MHERQYLVDDLNVKDTWRMFQIMAEFVEGFDTLPEVYPAVTLFGSARTQPSSNTYKNTEILAGLLVENGFNVISGGGPGIMEAANKGAAEKGGKSVGLKLNRTLPSSHESSVGVSKVITGVVLSRVIFLVWVEFSFQTSSLRVTLYQ